MNLVVIFKRNKMKYIKNYWKLLILLGLNFKQSEVEWMNSYAYLKNVFIFHILFLISRINNKFLIWLMFTNNFKIT